MALRENGTIVITAALLAACLLAGEARAFKEVPAEEKQVGLQAAPQSDIQSMPGIVIQQAPAGFEFKTEEAGKGREITIPGIGSIGVLPKMDFGLELLYGPSAADQGTADPAKPDDVQIKGTIKHRF